VKINPHKKLRLGVVLLVASAFSLNLLAETFQLGDVAPRGAPDGLLNAADALLLQRMVLGDIVPDETEKKIGDVAPLGNVDGVLNTGDLVVQQRAVLGEITLGTIDISSLQPPILAAAVTPTNNNPYTITGVATPDTLVDIYVEGTIDQQIRSNISDGAFSVDVYLFDGVNTIYATETDGIDSSSLSNIVQVQYDNIIDRNNLPTNISVDTVWTPGEIPLPYIVSSTLTIDAGVSLKIQPGTELKFEPGASIVVNGSLIVAGTAQNRASFTSNQAQQASNDWQGIVVNDMGAINIEYSDIEYANIGVQFNPGSDGEIHYSKIANNKIYGIYALGDDVNISNNPSPIITLNSIFNNENLNYAAVYYANSVNEVLDATDNWWGTLVSPDVVSKLSIYNSARAPLINVENILSSDGGSRHAISILHGTLPQPIYNITGTAELGRNLLIQNGQSLTTKIGGIIKSNNNPLTVDGVLTLENGSYLEWASILIINGSLVMEEDSKLSTAFSGNLRIYGNWIMAAGSRFESSCSNNFNCNNIYGTLSVIGNNTKPVVFTYKSDVNLPPASPGDWGGLRVKDGGQIDMEHAVITYAATGVYFDSGSSGAIKNTTITKNIAGVSAIGNNILQKNPNITINFNNIYDNSTNFSAGSFANSDSSIIDANDNWWGTTDASLILTKISAANAYGTPYIDVRNILDSKNGVRYNTEIWHSRLPVPVVTFNGKAKLGNTLTINAGESLTLTQNSILDFGGQKLTVYGDILLEQGSNIIADSPGLATNSFLTVFGTLTATGTASNRVRFKSANIIAEENGVVNIDYAIIEYAGYGILFRINSSGTVSNTIFSDNFYGIYLNGVLSPTIISNTIVDNYYGIYIRKYLGVNPQPVITNNDIYSNNTNLYLNGVDSASPLNISGNWWGTDVIDDIRLTITELNSDQIALVLLDAISPLANSALAPINLYYSQLFISPQSSPGSQDSSNLTATFLQPANWKIEIKNNVGQVIKTFSDINNVINVTWFGRNESSQYVADGIYSIIVSVDNIEVRRIHNVVVDNTPPEAAFIAGLQGATIDTNSYIIKGTAYDENFTNYLVEYSSDGLIWTTIEEVKTAQVNLTDSLVNWVIIDNSGVLPPPPSGALTLRLTVSDMAGNNIEKLTNITLSSFAVYNVMHTVTTIYPTQGDTSKISFSINTPATVTLKIINEETGAVVRTYVQNYLVGGSYDYTWDGKDDGNNYVPDEAYIYTISADNGAGQTEYIPDIIFDESSISGATFSVDYDVVKNEYFKILLFNNATTSRLVFCVNPIPSIQLIVDCDEPGSIIISKEPFEPFGPQYYYWNGRDLAGNEINNRDYHFFFPQPTNLPENTIIVKDTVPSIYGEGIAPNIEVKSNPYIVHHSYEEFSQIRFQVNQDSAVTAKLLPPGINDPNDLNSIVLLDNQPVVANVIETMTWNGYLDTDTNNILITEEGMYTFTIQATSNVTGLTTLYRGALTINQ